MALKPEIKARWLEALRSGKYQQSKNWLRTIHGYCCLGVLCDVLKPELETDWEKVAFEDYRIAGNYATLSEDIRQIVGMTMEEECALSTLNDDENKTFKEIADYIEENL